MTRTPTLPDLLASIYVAKPDGRKVPSILGRLRRKVLSVQSLTVDDAVNLDSSEIKDLVVDIADIWVLSIEFFFHKYARKFSDNDCAMLDKAAFFMLMSEVFLARIEESRNDADEFLLETSSDCARLFVPSFLSDSVSVATKILDSQEENNNVTTERE